MPVHKGNEQENVINQVRSPLNRARVMLTRGLDKYRTSKVEWPSSRSKTLTF